MSERLKYFIFNKESDYRRGYLESMEVQGNGICAKKDSKQRSVFLSRVLDCYETEMRWHRLKIRGNEKGQAAFRLTVYAGNERSFLYQGEEIALDDFIRHRDITLEEKKRQMSPWLQKQSLGMNEMLLHEVKGRYLWFLLEMYWQENSARIYDIQIFFPKQSWLMYLPEIYQVEDKDGFLDRFLGIFQTVYEDINEEIRMMAKNFDMESAKDDYLVWLAQWIGVNDSYVWSKEQLRRFLKHGVSLYRRRGTRQGIMDFVMLYTGERPFIVESHQRRYFERDKKRLKQWNRLYGSSANSFTLLIREEVLGSIWQQKTLMRIVEEVKPVQTGWNLILLRPYIFIGQHSYVGINSVLGKYRAIALDGHSAVSFAVLEDMDNI